MFVSCHAVLQELSENLKCGVMWWVAEIGSMLCNAHGSKEVLCQSAIQISVVTRFMAGESFVIQNSVLQIYGWGKLRSVPVLVQ